MASKTAARSGARSSSSKPRPRTTRPAAPRRKPAPRRNPSPVAAAGSAIGKGARASWLMVAKGAGSTARSVGRARELEPGHRRDGIALALLALSVVLAASSWFDAARPVGGWIDSVVRAVIGSAVVLLPILLIVSAVLVMCTEPHPAARPRLLVGTPTNAPPGVRLW